LMAQPQEDSKVCFQANSQKKARQGLLCCWIV